MSHAWVLVDMSGDMLRRQEYCPTCRNGRVMVFDVDADEWRPDYYVADGRTTAVEPPCIAPVVVMRVALLDGYQQAALRTWKEEPDGVRRVMNAALGLGGEVGEVLDTLKKIHFHNRALEREDLKSELGDVLYYLAVLAHEHGWTLAEVAQANVDKLRARHPEGFDPSYHEAGAQQRNEEA